MNLFALMFKIFVIIFSAYGIIKTVTAYLSMDKSRGKIYRLDKSTIMSPMQYLLFGLLGDGLSLGLAFTLNGWALFVSCCLVIPVSYYLQHKFLE